MMDLFEGGFKAENSAIERIEKWKGLPLPSSYKILLATHDGADGAPNVTFKKDDAPYGLKAFIPAKNIQRESDYIETLPKRAIPFAFDSCGNYFLMTLNNAGAVSFWDHEDPENIISLTDSFEDFLEGLYLDNEEIELTPDEIANAWIDPDFLKEIKSKE